MIRIYKTERSIVLGKTGVYYQSTQKDWDVLINQTNLYKAWEEDINGVNSIGVRYGYRTPNRIVAAQECDATKA